MKTYDKLIRDYVLYHLDMNGIKYKSKNVSKEEKLEYLYKKVIEELEELKQNPGIEELVDLYEVLETLRIEMKISKKQLESKRIHKRRHKGGFRKNIVLLEVED